MSGWSGVIWDLWRCGEGFLGRGWGSGIVGEGMSWVFVGLGSGGSWVG